MTRCVPLAVSLLCCPAASARAGWITFDYAVAGGGVGLAYGTRLADLGLTYGMPMSGRVNYNPSVPGEWMSDPITGGGSRLRFWRPSAVWRFPEERGTGETSSELRAPSSALTCGRGCHGCYSPCSCSPGACRR
jgi:hypothetical protein